MSFGMDRRAPWSSEILYRRSRRQRLRFPYTLRLEAMLEPMGGLIKRITASLPEGADFLECKVLWRMLEGLPDFSGAMSWSSASVNAAEMKWVVTSQLIRERRFRAKFATDAGVIVDQVEDNEVAVEFIRRMISQERIDELTARVSRRYREWKGLDSDVDLVAADGREDSLLASGYARAAVAMAIKLIHGVEMISMSDLGRIYTAKYDRAWTQLGLGTRRDLTKAILEIDEGVEDGLGVWARQLMLSFFQIC